MHTVYTNGRRESPILRDLIEDEITINPNFITNKLIFGNGDKRHNYSVVEQETPFKEIKIVPYEDSEHHKEAINFVGNSRRSVDCKAYLETLEEVVNSQWDPRKFNLVYHSSGFDSRLMSHFIRKSYENSPGPILFVCWGDECDSFKDIMEYQGWDESQYITIPPTREKYIYPFSFATVWKHVNGGSWHFSASMYHTALDYLRVVERVPRGNINIWTGLTNNELIRWPKDLNGNYKSLYYSWTLRMWGVIGGVEAIHPFLDIRLGKILFSAVNRKDKVRRQLLKLADPKLEGFLRTATSKLTVSFGSLQRMVQDFKQSYYYQNIDPVDPDFKADILMHDGRCRRYHIFWRKWTVASLIEELVGRGVHVSYG